MKKLGVILIIASAPAVYAASGDVELRGALEQPNFNRTYDPTQEADGARRATGEGLGTSTGTVTDMGPDNNILVDEPADDADHPAGVGNRTHGDAGNEVDPSEGSATEVNPSNRSTDEPAGTPD